MTVQDENARSGINPDVYYDPYFEQHAVKVLPGEFFVTGKDMMIVSVVGSCVCVCIRDRLKELGGMCHFIVPDRFLDSAVSSIGAIHYAGHAMEMLTNQLIKMGSQRRDLVAKVFGASNWIKTSDAKQLCEMNAHFVLHYLQQESIQVASQDLLQPYPSKLYFFPRTGKVLVKRLHKLNNTTLLDRESEYLERLVDMDLSGPMELFN